MSSAHRPTWTPAMGKDARLNTKQYSSRDIAGHTKLKYRQPGQNSKEEISRRDLKLELILAEKEANAKKRRAAGLLPLVEEPSSSSTTKLIQQTPTDDGEDDEVKAKRRKILEEALLADKDDSDSEDEDEDRRKQSKKSGKAMEKNGDDQSLQGDNGGDVVDDDDDESSDDSDDDENETAELLKELEKIKRERAEEKERLEQERAATDAVDKETSAAMGNPLLNLKAALNNGNTSPTNSVSTSTTSFSVKKRWDDDVIFKNQARDVNEKPKKEFVNDLLRTEFHRRFLKKFIA